MFDHVVVAVDGSDRSWTAAEVGDELAVRSGARLEMLHVIVPSADRGDATEVRERLERSTFRTRSVELVLAPRTDSVAATIVEHLEGYERGCLVMGSAGRGRTASILGSVARDVLVRTSSPVVFAGDACRPHLHAAGAPLIVPVDGSLLSEAALEVAATWGAEFDFQPWVVWVSAPDFGLDDKVLEITYPAALAARWESTTRRPFRSKVLNSLSPADAIAEFASTQDAGLIVATTRGRSGVDRVLLGSVASAMVRQSPCPVVLSRPPHLASDFDVSANTQRGLYADREVQRGAT